ncbi:MAG: dihydrolipoyl dehydrogenase, partial [Limisphaerales bacterium]
EPTKTELVVVGAGPGGYAAAFYAADLGKKVTLIEQDPKLGGVCLNRGCIPSKALLHAAHSVTAAKESAQRGITFAAPHIELDKLRAWKDSIITKLAGGIAQLAQKRGVTVLRGRACFEASQTLRVATEAGPQHLSYEHAIVAVGSQPALPTAFDLGNPRVMTSTEALEIAEIPEKLLVIGGGYIGMELGTVYAALGSQVTVIEALDSILLGADADLARPVMAYAKKNFSEIRVKAKVLQMTTVGNQIKVVSEQAGRADLPVGHQLEELFDRVLVSVGRVPNSQGLGLEHTQAKLDERGLITVNDQQQTNDPAIYAIGDIAGGLMLAHKASRDARTAVEAICGKPSTRKAVLPAVVFTDPEIARCGLTDTEAKSTNIPHAVAKFPWGASGRALTFDRTDGLTKLIIDPATERVLGVGIVGHGAGELIAEGVLAIEMGATAKDLSLCVHPHPTLSETVMESAEVFYGHATHVLPRKR